MELLKAIKERRSVRKYRSDPVPEEMIHVLLESVQWAPSWANTQCWEVILVRDPDMKSELAKTLPKGNPAISSMNEAPILLVLCGIKGISGYYKGQPATEKGDWLMFDTALAMENLCLTAHAVGLGTVIVGMFDHRKVADLLGVPSSVDVVAMTPLGYPAGEGARPKRKDVSKFVFQEKYGEGRG